MTAEFWREVEAAFAALIRLTPDARRAWLDRERAARPELAAEVEALLASHDAAEAFLSAADPAAGATRLQPPPGGATIPGFRLLEPIGHGGMGVVYRAERADGEFTRQAAIKVIGATMQSDEARRRFRTERQILAGLQHPGIVTLFDGGFTARGEAYLVMEHVDGLPLTRFCGERRPSLEVRLGLVRQVAAAVHYAHQRGVVHRDLKPANILVTSDGLTKVLDFGIARLVDPEAAGSDRTATEFGTALTPNYASPEQLRGLTATTASDIYSLGVLLYEVIAGRRPYDTAGLPLDDVLARVLSGTHERPSAAAARADLPYPGRAVRGELDAIVSKAMAVDPARRYASADELAQDLGRLLAREPVQAREPSWSYVLTGLLRRHRAAAAATVVSIVALVAALGVSLWQTRVAVAERQRAEQRFDELRRLANVLIFDIHDGVRALPGSTDLRRRIVAEALVYLEGLSAEPGADASLLHDLGRGYLRIGTVQGRPSAPNLGDRDGAVTSLERSIAILEDLANRDGAPAVVRDLVEAYVVLGEIRRAAGDRAGALALFSAATARAEALVAADASTGNRQALGAALFQEAVTAPPEAALPIWTQALHLYEALLAAAPDDDRSLRNLALVHKQIGAVHGGAARVDDAIRHFSLALELDERRLSVRPDDRSALLDVAIDLANLASQEYARGRGQEVVRLLERSLIMRQRIVDSDPDDVQAVGRLAYVHGALSSGYLDLRRPSDAVRHARRAVEMAEPLASLDAMHKVELAGLLLRLGRAEQAAGRRAEGCAALRRAEALLSGTDVIQVQTRPRVQSEVQRALQPCGP